ncbi:MAG: M20/M25/M40 family metallo-hydrolase [Nakamurella sp.]
MTDAGIVTAGTEEFDAAAVIELAAALVRLRTVHDGRLHTVEAPAVVLVADLMHEFGWDVTVTEVSPGRQSVVGVIEGSAAGGSTTPSRTLMFEGHVDVVTEGDPAGWSFDPYAGDIVAGHLRGRGSADMKSGVAAMLYAARAVQLAGFNGRLVVGVLADEEGMMLGAKRFARDLMAGNLPGVDAIDGVIVCEPEGGEVCPVAKGAIRIMVTFHGEMAHGAMPKMGRNPLPAIGSLLIALTEIERGYQARVGGHPSLGDFSMTPTALAGGSLEQVNVIPATAVLAVDVRTLPGVEHQELIALVRSLAASLAAEHRLEAVVEILDDRPPVDTPVGDPVVQAMLAGHRAATGEDAVLGGVPGTTDGTILTRDAALPTVVYGPGGKWIAHQVDEVVEVAEIITCTRAYIAAARHFLTAGDSGPTDSRPIAHSAPPERRPAADGQRRPV